jgi:hypothetical protein
LSSWICTDNHIVFSANSVNGNIWNIYDQEMKNIQEEIKMGHVTVLVDKSNSFLLSLNKANPIDDRSMVQSI